MKQLVYDPEIDRYVIQGGGEEIELHCGDVFEVLVDNHWIRTSIEMKWLNGTGTYYLTTGALSIENIVAYKVPVR